jgi:hypothetical protein
MREDKVLSFARLVASSERSRSTRSARMSLDISSRFVTTFLSPSLWLAVMENTQ